MASSGDFLGGYVPCKISVYYIRDDISSRTNVRSCIDVDSVHVAPQIGRYDLRKAAVRDYKTGEEGTVTDEEGRRNVSDDADLGSQSVTNKISEEIGSDDVSGRPDVRGRVDVGRVHIACDIRRDRPRETCIRNEYAGEKRPVPDEVSRCYVPGHIDVVPRQISHYVYSENGREHIVDIHPSEIIPISYKERSRHDSGDRYVVRGYGVCDNVAVERFAMDVTRCPYV